MANLRRFRLGKGPKPISNSVRRNRRKALFKRDGRDCFYCGLPLDETVTLEHLVDVCAGGTHDLDNLVLAHRLCNTRVVGLSVEEKMRVRRARSAHETPGR